jgi:hypothetical protein
MFKVIAKGFNQEFELWTEALAVAKTRMPQCQWFDEVRILDKQDLVWIYSKSHKYPQFIGPGTYDRLAKRFLLETTALEQGLDQAVDGGLQLELGLEAESELSNSV